MFKSLELPIWLSRGLIVAIIAGFILLFVQYNFFERKTTQDKITNNVQTLNAPSALIATQGQNGNNTVQLIGHQGRQITPDIKLSLQPFVQSGQPTEVRTDSSDEATDFAKDIRDYLISRGVQAYIDPTSVYMGSFGYGLHLDLNNHIIRVGKNDE